MADIILLKENPEYAPILAFWAYREWYKTRVIEFNLVIQAYYKRLNDNNPPITWAAIEDGIPVGMVSLKENDLWSRKDLNPWLASLFVLPEYRKHGIGTKLVNTVIEKATDLKYTDLYLFWDPLNSYLAEYYDRIGWEFHAEAVGNDEKPINIYFYKL